MADALEQLGKATIAVVLGLVGLYAWARLIELVEREPADTPETGGINRKALPWDSHLGRNADHEQARESDEADDENV